MKHSALASKRNTINTCNDSRNAEQHTTRPLNHSIIPLPATESASRQQHTQSPQAHNAMCWPLLLGLLLLLLVLSDPLIVTPAGCGAVWTVH